MMAALPTRVASRRPKWQKPAWDRAQPTARWLKPPFDNGRGAPRAETTHAAERATRVLALCLVADQPMVEVQAQLQWSGARILKFLRRYIASILFWVGVVALGAVTATAAAGASWSAGSLFAYLVSSLGWSAALAVVQQFVVVPATRHLSEWLLSRDAFRTPVASRALGSDSAGVANSLAAAAVWGLDLALGNYTALGLKTAWWSANRSYEAVRTLARHEILQRFTRSSAKLNRPPPARPGRRNEDVTADSNVRNVGARSELTAPRPLTQRNVPGNVARITPAVREPPLPVRLEVAQQVLTTTSAVLASALASAYFLSTSDVKSAVVHSTLASAFQFLARAADVNVSAPLAAHLRRVTSQQERTRFARRRAPAAAYSKVARQLLGLPALYSPHQLRALPLSKLRALVQAPRATRAQAQELVLNRQASAQRELYLQILEVVEGVLTQFALQSALQQATRTLLARPTQATCGSGKLLRSGKCYGGGDEVPRNLHATATTGGVRGTALEPAVAGSELFQQSGVDLGTAPKTGVAGGGVDLGTAVRTGVAGAGLDQLGVDLSTALKPGTVRRATVQDNLLKLIHELPDGYEFAPLLQTAADAGGDAFVRKLLERTARDSVKTLLWEAGQGMALRSGNVLPGLVEVSQQCLLNVLYTKMRATKKVMEVSSVAFKGAALYSVAELATELYASAHYTTQQSEQRAHFEQRQHLAGATPAESYFVDEMQSAAVQHGYDPTRIKSLPELEPASLPAWLAWFQPPDLPQYRSDPTGAQRLDAHKKFNESGEFAKPRADAAFARAQASFAATVGLDFLSSKLGVVEALQTLVSDKVVSNAQYSLKGYLQLAFQETVRQSAAANGADFSSIFSKQIVAMLLLGPRRDYGVVPRALQT